MMETNLIQMIYFIGILVATLFVSLGEFYRKLKAGHFDGWSDFATEYMILTLFSIVASVIATFLLLYLQPITLTDPGMAFAAGLTIGLASKPTLEMLWKFIDPDWWP